MLGLVIERRKTVTPLSDISPVSSMRIYIFMYSIKVVLDFNSDLSNDLYGADYCVTFTYLKVFKYIAVSVGACSR